MYQDIRPAVIDSEISAAIIAPHDVRGNMISRTFDSIKFKKVFLNPREKLDEYLLSSTPDVVVLYVDNDNAFLFRLILSIKNKYDIPTLVISKDYDEFTAVLALELGADEYLSSQVGANELRLRVLRICKKYESRATAKLKVLNEKPTVVEANLSNRNCSALSRDRAAYYSLFTPYEFEVLLLLVNSPGQPLARDTISLAVRGRSSNKTDRSIDNIIARVRKKLLQLGFSKYLIRGFHSFGYIFTGDAENFLDKLEDAIKEEGRGISSAAFVSE